MNKKQTIVVKLGGSLINTLPAAFFQECAKLHRSGVRIVIVHGGGPKINEYTRRLQLEAAFVDGLRVTDEHVLELAEMVLAGSVNKWLVTQLEQAGGAALGLSGVDRGLIQVKPKDPALGYVGTVDQVNPDVIAQLCALNWIPVIASLGVDQQGQHFNVNADTAAGAVAAALGADQLVMVTDVPGILAGPERETIPSVTPGEIEQFIADGTIDGGMIPKVQACVACVANGVATVCLADGRAAGVLTGLAGLHDGLFPGTRIVAEGSETFDHDTHANIFAMASSPR